MRLRWPWKTGAKSSLGRRVLEDLLRSRAIAHSGTCRDGRRLAGRLLRAGSILTLLCFFPARAPAQEARLDLQAVIFATPGAPDRIGLSYASKLEPGQAKADMLDLAQRLGAPEPRPLITVKGGITSSEAEMPGLTDWTSGAIALTTLAQTFKRFGRFRVTCLFFGKFPIRGDRDVTEGPVRIIVNRRSEGMVDYVVEIDRSRGVPTDAAIKAGVGRTDPGGGWQWALGLAAILLVVGGALALVLVVLRGQRSAVRAAEETSTDD